MHNIMDIVQVYCITVTLSSVAAVVIYTCIVGDINFCTLAHNAFLTAVGVCGLRYRGQEDYH